MIGQSIENDDGRMYTQAELNAALAEAAKPGPCGKHPKICMDNTCKVVNGRCIYCASLEREIDETTGECVVSHCVACSMTRAELSKAEERHRAVVEGLRKDFQTRLDDCTEMLSIWVKRARDLESQLTAANERVAGLEEALSGLCRQVEISGGIDDHGHEMKNLQALKVGRALLTPPAAEAEGNDV